MVKVKLHGPLDGLYKAYYDTRDAELTIRYGTKSIQLDESECDSLLRLYEVAQDPAEDMAEFFNDVGFGRDGYRVAQSFTSHTVALAKLIYD